MGMGVHGSLPPLPLPPWGQPPAPRPAPVSAVFPAPSPDPPGSSAQGAELPRHLGSLAVFAQAVASIGLTLTAVLNIPEASRSAGRATWICYLLALATIVLVSETLVLFRRLPAGPQGIAGYVGGGLGARAAAGASWSLLLGYATAFLACLTFFGNSLDRLLPHLGLPMIGVGGFLAGGLLCWQMVRRDVRLSAHTMLLTESISVTIVLALTLLVFRQGGPSMLLRELTPAGDSFAQVRSGLMVAVFSFIGFESAATLGGEALRPAVVVPRAMRASVVLAGVLFLIWAVVLPEGLAWLPPAERSGLDPLRDLADQLGQPGAGLWIEAGAFLCLFGTCLGSLTALGRISFALAGVGVLPGRLAWVHPRFGTPAAALGAVGIPLMLGGALPVARGVDVNRLFDLFGSTSVLAFLLVYGLVALAGLRGPLPGTSSRRRQLVAGACLLAVSALALAYLSGVWRQHSAVVIAFGLLLGAGWWRAWRLAPGGAAASMEEEG